MSLLTMFCLSLHLFYEILTLFTKFQLKIQNESLNKIPPVIFLSLLVALILFHCRLSPGPKPWSFCLFCFVSFAPPPPANLLTNHCQLTLKDGKGAAAAAMAVEGGGTSDFIIVSG